MNRWKKMVIEKYADQLGFEPTDLLLDTANFLYSGEEPELDELKAINEMTKVQQEVRNCRHDLIRSIERANIIVDSLQQLDDEEVDPDDDESLADFQHKFTQTTFDEDLDDLKDAQKTITFLGNEGDAEESVQLDDKEVEKRRQFMQYWDASPAFKKFLNLFGRYYAHCSKILRERVFPDPTAMAEVVPGNSIPDLISSERVNMAVPELEDLFYTRFAQYQTLQYKRSSPKNVGRGDVTVYLDISGSMQTYDLMDKAAAVTLALAKSFEKQSRKCHIILFNARLIEFEYDSFLDLCVKLFRIRSGGGTEFSKVLNHIVEDDAEDALIITDMEGDISSKYFNMEFEQRVVVLDLLAGSFYRRGSPPFEEVADVVIPGNSVKSFQDFMQEGLK